MMFLKQSGLKLPAFPKGYEVEEGDIFTIRASLLSRENLSGLNTISPYQYKNY